MMKPTIPSSAPALTAAQLARKSLPEPQLGFRLYRPTNELRFASPIAAISGRFGDEVYHVRNGKQFVRRYVAPRAPDAPKQVEQQNRMKLVMPAWTALSAEVRQAWQDYAVKHFGANQLGKKTGNLGQNLFTSAQSNRLAWGGELSAAQPRAALPGRVIQVVEMAAPAGQMAWRVEHGMSATVGYRLEVRMTPAAKNGRKPRECRLVRAGKTSAGSFFEMGASGSTHLLEEPVHAVAPGERYGLQVKLISPDGVEGRAYYVELTRKAPGELAPAGSLGTPGSSLALNPSRLPQPDLRADDLSPELAGSNARLEPGVPRDPT